MRTIWKGAINFGLVNIPIKLLTATQKNNIKFRFLHQECNTPVKNVRYCPNCERQIEYDEIVRGYEYEDNKFVILSEEDFDNLPVKSTKTIDIVDFVKLSEIDPVYYIKTYYLEPSEGGEKPYFLLKKSMENSQKVAIGRVAIRDKESLSVIRTMDNVLALETMYYADEVRSAEGIIPEKLEEKIEISSREEEMAEEIISNMTSEFVADKYENKYREALMDVIRKKIEGKEVKEVEVKVPEGKVIDLMEKLKASVEVTEKEKKAEKKKEKSKKKTG